MKRIIIAAAVIPFSVTAAAAQDAGPTGAYVQVHGGTFFPTQDEVNADFGDGNTASQSLDYGLGFAIGGLVGYAVTPNVSIEGEVTYRSVDGEVEGIEVVVVNDDTTTTVTQTDIDTDVFAFMANARYDFETLGRYTPYVVAGLGYATADIDEDGEDDTIDLDGAFAYQVKAGVTVPAGQGAFGTEVSYFGTSEFEDAEDDAISAEFGGVAIHATYTFGF